MRQPNSEYSSRRTVSVRILFETCLYCNIHFRSLVIQPSRDGVIYPGVPSMYTRVRQCNVQIIFSMWLILLGITVLPSTSVFPCHYHFTIFQFIFTFLLGENASEVLLSKPKQYFLKYLRTLDRKKYIWCLYDRISLIQ